MEVGDPVQRGGEVVLVQLLVQGIADVAQRQLGAAAHVVVLLGAVFELDPERVRQRPAPVLEVVDVLVRTGVAEVVVQVHLPAHPAQRPPEARAAVRRPRGPEVHGRDRLEPPLRHRAGLGDVVRREADVRVREQIDEAERVEEPVFRPEPVRVLGLQVRVPHPDAQRIAIVDEGLQVRHARFARGRRVPELKRAPVVDLHPVFGVGQYVRVSVGDPLAPTEDRPLQVRTLQAQSEHEPSGLARAVEAKAPAQIAVRPLEPGGEERVHGPSIRPDVEHRLVLVLGGRAPLAVDLEHRLPGHGLRHRQADRVRQRLAEVRLLLEHVAGPGARVLHVALDRRREVRETVGIAEVHPGLCEETPPAVIESLAPCEPGIAAQVLAVHVVVRRRGREELPGARARVLEVRAVEQGAARVQIPAEPQFVSLGEGELGVQVDPVARVFGVRARGAVDEGRGAHAEELLLPPRLVLEVVECAEAIARPDPVVVVASEVVVDVERQHAGLGEPVVAPPAASEIPSAERHRVAPPEPGLVHVVRAPEEGELRGGGETVDRQRSRVRNPPGHRPGFTARGEPRGHVLAESGSHGCVLHVRAESAGRTAEIARPRLFLEFQVDRPLFLTVGDPRELGHVRFLVVDLHAVHGLGGQVLGRHRGVAPEELPAVDENVLHLLALRGDGSVGLDLDPRKLAQKVLHRRVGAGPESERVVAQRVPPVQERDVVEGDDERVHVHRHHLEVDRADVHVFTGKGEILPHRTVSEQGDLKDVLAGSEVSEGEDAVAAGRRETGEDRVGLRERHHHGAAEAPTLRVGDHAAHRVLGLGLDGTGGKSREHEPAREQRQNRARSRRRHRANRQPPHRGPPSKGRRRLPAPRVARTSSSFSATRVSYSSRVTISPSVGGAIATSPRPSRFTSVAE